jgi:hypothetical protein
MLLTYKEKLYLTVEDVPILGEECENDWLNHRISIPAFDIEQQWWQSGVPKNEMSLIFKYDARSLDLLCKLVTTWLSFKSLLTRL